MKRAVKKAKKIKPVKAWAVIDDDAANITGAWLRVSQLESVCVLAVHRYKHLARKTAAELGRYGKYSIAPVTITVDG